MSIETAFFAVVARVETKTAKTSGKPYLRLNLRDGDGESAQWINCMVFEPDVVAAADKLKAGMKLYIEGNLRLDRWQASDGSGEKSGLSVMANHVRVPQIGTNKPKREDDASSRAPGNVRAQRYSELDDAIPF
jgi:single-stranded DNA-binding protein